MINRKYVVTAAHCHHEGIRGLEIIEVVLGEFDVSKDPDCKDCRGVQRIVPEEIVIHQDYAATAFISGESDIALVRLETPAITLLEDYDSVVLPICLGYKGPLEQAELHVAGWGKINNDPIYLTKDFVELGVSQRTLQRLKVPFVSHDRCRTYYANLAPTQICAGGIVGQ